MADVLLVSLIVRHADGSVSSQAFRPSPELFAEVQQHLSGSGPLYHRHIPAEQVAAWAPLVNKLGVIV